MRSSLKNRTIVFFKDKFSPEGYKKNYTFQINNNRWKIL